jgi:anti-sigma B factor antagonist
LDAFSGEAAVVTGFNVEVRREGGDAIVAVQGELDIATAPRLNEAVATALEGPPARLVIDLSATGFIDSSGIRALARAHHDVESTPTRLMVVCPPENRDVHQVLTLVGLDQTLPVVSSLGEAAELHRGGDARAS